MTQEEAKQALKQGKKVSHEYFTPEEYIMLCPNGSGQLIDEAGIKLDYKLFWKYRQHDIFQTNWRIVE